MQISLSSSRVWANPAARARSCSDKSGRRLSGDLALPTFANFRRPRPRRRADPGRAAQTALLNEKRLMLDGGFDDGRQRAAGGRGWASVADVLRQWFGGGKERAVMTTETEAGRLSAKARILALRAPPPVLVLAGFFVAGFSMTGRAPLRMAQVHTGRCPIDPSITHEIPHARDPRGPAQCASGGSLTEVATQRDHPGVSIAPLNS